MALSTWTRCVVCAVTCSLSSANRVRASAASDADVSSMTVKSGSVLRGRYVLHHFLYRTAFYESDELDDDSQPYSRRTSFPRDIQAIPTKDFPESAAFDDIDQTAKINEFRGEEKTHLGKGSFGDVWKAYDSHRGTEVAVKIFFRDGKYLTPAKAKHLKKTYKLAEAKEECQLVIDMMEHADIFPDGAQHICQCFEEHISDAGSDDPLFLVLELCGVPLDQIHDNVTYMKESPPYYSRNVIMQVLQGVQFMSKLPTPLVHHDLKLENVVVRADGMAKIIDFGAVIPFQNGKTGGVCTPQYVPPEVYCDDGPSFNWNAPASAFDTYSVGVMYWELLCNSRPRWDDDDYSEIGYEIFDPIPLHKKCHNKSLGVGTIDDFNIIKGLLEPDPFERMEPSNAISSLAPLLNESHLKFEFEGEGSQYFRATEARCRKFQTPEACASKAKCEWKEHKDDSGCHLADGHRDKGEKLTTAQKWTDLWEHAGMKVTENAKKLKKCFKCTMAKIRAKVKKAKSDMKKKELLKLGTKAMKPAVSSRNPFA